MTWTRNFTILAMTGAALAWLAPLSATPKLQKKSVISLEVRPLIQVGGQTGSLAARRFDVAPGEGGVLEIQVSWPVAEASQLRLFALSRETNSEDRHQLDLEAELVLPDRRRIVARRTLDLVEDRTGLFELFRMGDQALSLAIRAERRTVHELAQPTLGIPVGFKLEVDYVGEHGTVPLESNHLSTFIGEPVTYAFDRGENDARQSLQLVLRPVGRQGDLVEIELEFSGSLPGPNRLLLSRRETLYTSRRATSSLVVTNGEPATGYRFRITPDF